MMQDDGRFDPEAVRVIKPSLVEMHILDFVGRPDVHHEIRAVSYWCVCQNEASLWSHIMDEHGMFK